LTARQELIKVYARQLKLPTLTSCQEVIRQAEEQGLSYEEFLCEVLRRELSQREEDQKKRKLKEARFPLEKSLDTFEFKHLEHVEEAHIWQLATGE